MIEYIEGDIFQSPAQVIVNTVNTVGVMGKGLALSFKKRYPEMFEAYRAACEKHQLTIGRLMLYYAPDHWILMFPTKENWRNPSKIEYIEAGLKKFVEVYAEKGISSIAFPKLGCGNGGLKWDVVKKVMEKYLKSLPITVYIYTGVSITETPEHTAQKDMIQWLKANSKDMSFGGLCDDLNYTTTISPIEFIAFNDKWSAIYQEGLVFNSDIKSYHITKDEMFILWDYLRHYGIITINDNDIKSQLFYSILDKQGYLSKIKLFDENDICLNSGYQLNIGCGRIYALRGEA